MVNEFEFIKLIKEDCSVTITMKEKRVDKLSMKRMKKIICRKKIWNDLVNEMYETK